MRKIMLHASTALVVCGWLASAGLPARGEDRPADKIVAELKAIEPPKYDPEMRNDSKALANFMAARQKVQQRRSELIRELYRAHADDSRLPALLNERWQTLMTGGLGGLPNPELADELDDVIKHSENKTLRADAAYFKAVSSFRANRGELEALVAKIDEFIKVAPQDERGAMLLYAVANQMSGSAEKQTALFRRIQADYPTSQPAKMVEGNLKRLEGIGKPFELAFDDAIKGNPVSIKGLKGKVVVIDFWATWCGPCVAELPKMKDLYEKYHDKGVEFIGVSLDQPKEEGGLDALKEFVAKREVPWPQYYQGKGWKSEFSLSWGINSIPALFVVDREGKLYSVEARGKLDQMIPKLLRLEVSGAAVPPPAVEPTGKDVSGFNFWGYEKDDEGRTGYFQKEEGKRWVEMKDGKVLAHFEETRRTPDFIELYDEGRSMALRLYDGKIFWKTDGQEAWNLLPFAAIGKIRKEK